MRHASNRLLTSSAAALLVLATPALVSCSSGSAAGDGASTVSTAAPSPPAGSSSPQASGGGSSPQASEDTTVGVGNDVPLPQNWPTEIPVYEGGSLVSVVVVGDATEINAVWLTDASALDAAATMDDAMRAAGFTAGIPASTSDMSSVDYSGNGFTVNVTAYSSGDQTNLSINASRD